MPVALHALLAIALRALLAIALRALLALALILQSAPPGLHDETRQNTC